MRSKLIPLAAALAIGGSALAMSTSASADRSAKVLEFDTMAGVSKPYTGATNPVRGLGGGGIPWVLTRANGELRANGKVEVEVRGLVLDPKDPVAIARGIGGTNPIPQFKAIVSCQSADASGAPTVVNVSTGLVTADAMGNAEIEDKVMLPTPCIAPIVFVTNAGGAWFAATGV